MSGLVLSLKPNEKFLVNGAMLVNGPKRGQICVEDNDVYVLRLSDVIHPEEVTTPVKRVYYALQLILSCDMKVDEALDPILEGLNSLSCVFENTPYVKHAHKAQSAVLQDRYYSALCSLKSLLEIETDLFKRHAETQRGSARGPDMSNTLASSAMAQTG